MFLTALLLILSVDAKPARIHKGRIHKAKFSPLRKPLMEVLGELKPLSEARAKKCEEWIDSVVDSVPASQRGLGKIPASVIPALIRKLEEYPESPAELLKKLETLSKGLLRPDNTKEEAEIINQIEARLQLCSPLNAVTFMDQLTDSIPAGDQTTLKKLSHIVMEKAQSELSGGGFYAPTLTQAGILQYFSDRAGWVLKRGQKMKIRYHRKLLGTSIEESPAAYIKIKLDGMKQVLSLRQQLRTVLAEAGFKRRNLETVLTEPALPAVAPSTLPVTEPVPAPVPSANP